MEDQFETHPKAGETDQTDPFGSQRPAWASVIFISLTLLIGFGLIGPAIGFFLALPFIDGSMIDFVLKIQNPIGHPEVKIPFFILQGSAAFFGLAVAPALYWWVYERRNPFDLIRKKRIPLIIGVVTLLTVISFMVTNSVFIEWNAHVKFPEFLKGFGAWARESEDTAERLTSFLTTFDGPMEFVFTFFIVAVLAGFSEELVFRGMLQPLLQRATRNIHAGIWVSAFLFSAIHLQFFGFVPRMLLGALFGYLYYWSGNLLIPMLAHMINNGFSVVVLYLRQLGKIDFDVDSPEAAPWPAVLLFTFLTAGLLFYFYQFYKTRNSPTT